MAKQARSTKKSAAARPATKSAAVKAKGKAASAKAAGTATKRKPTATAAVKAEPKPAKPKAAAKSTGKAVKAEPKKTSAKKGAAASKLAETVEEFIAGVPDPAVAEGLRVFREQMRAIMPKGSTDKISYGVPIWHDANGLKVLGYGRAGKNCSIYVMDVALVKDYVNEGELNNTGVKASGSTLHYNPASGLPPGFLEKLVAIRLERAVARAPASKKAKIEAKGKGKGKR